MVVDRLLKYIIVILLFGFSSSLFANEESQEITINDYGKYGEVFEIIEDDLIEVMKEKLQKQQETGALQALEKKIEQNVRDNVRNPKRVAGIRKATEHREYYYDPSVFLKADIKDHNGKVLIRKGERFNPLDKMPFFEKELLFIDGEDEEQVEYLKKIIKADKNLRIITRHFEKNMAENQGSKEVNKGKNDVNNSRINWLPNEESKETLRIIPRRFAEIANLKIILVAGSPIDLQERIQTEYGLEEFIVYFDQEGALTRKLGISAIPAHVQKDSDSNKLKITAIDLRAER